MSLVQDPNRGQLNLNLSSSHLMVDRVRLACHDFTFDTDNTLGRQILKTLSC